MQPRPLQSGAISNNPAQAEARVTHMAAHLEWLSPSCDLRLRHPSSLKAKYKYRINTMKYDDASWHYGGNFPADLPNEAGATHSGMFLAWALLNGLAGPIHVASEIGILRDRSKTPGQFFMLFSDGKLTDEDLNDEGNAFAAAYFDLQGGKFLADYEAALGAGLPGLYHVPDTWKSYDVIRPVLDRRFAEWEGISLPAQVSQLRSGWWTRLVKAISSK